MLTAPGVFKDFNQHTCILVSVGSKHAKFIPMDCVLSVTKMPIKTFEETYTAMDYPVAKAARIYLNAELLSPTELAKRQLEAIASGESESLASLSTLEETNDMANAAAAKSTKPKQRQGGALAAINEFLDKNRDKIKSGEMTRKAAIEALVAKGFKKGTISIETGNWSKKNVQFKKPAKDEKPAKKPAAKAAAKPAAAKKAAAKPAAAKKAAAKPAAKKAAPAAKPAAKKAAAKPAAKPAAAKPAAAKPAAPVPAPAPVPAGSSNTPDGESK